MTDPIADFLTRIRNSIGARHRVVNVVGSKMKEQLAKILEQEGYISGWSSSMDGPKKTIEIQLKYGPRGQSVIQGLKRVSRPGRRLYCGASEVPTVLNGLGISIVSTSKGVLSGADARRQRVGGEVLCHVW